MKTKTVRKSTVVLCTEVEYCLILKRICRTIHSKRTACTKTRLYETACNAIRQASVTTHNVTRPPKLVKKAAQLEVITEQHCSTLQFIGFTAISGASTLNYHFTHHPHSLLTRTPVLEVAPITL